MVARDGIEPPTPAFSGLRSAIGEDVWQGFAATLHQENSDLGSLIVVPAQAEPIPGTQNETVAEPRQNDACRDRNELDIAEIA